MPKTILLTGATDGIGLEAAKKLHDAGHTLLLHGRSAQKLEAAVSALGTGSGTVETCLADLSSLKEVDAMAKELVEKHESIDALVNNAGVLKAPQTVTAEGLDIRFVVNTLAPYLLASRLLTLMDSTARIVNLSSAAQAPVSLDALSGQGQLADMEAYSQSKLAITMWTRSMAHSLGNSGPVVVAVNPGSLLATKMVKEGFGIAGNDINIGADIIIEAALGDSFAKSSGKYFDNDSGQFAPPHPDGTDLALCQAVETAVADLINRHVETPV